MIGWLIIVLALLGLAGLSMLLAHKWGRGAREGMSENLETEAASRISYWHQF